MLIDRQRNLQLAEILNHVAKVLNIPNKIFQQARRRYTDLNVWLKADHIERFQSDAGIYPQGSILLGTFVHPINPEDDFDVDLVYRRDIRKQSTSKKTLKKELGNQLHCYVEHLRHAGEEAPKLHEGQRCWTLDFKGQFHMDILPALPDEEAAQYNLRDLDDAIVITDAELHEWLHSNPKGYANWFDDQQKMLLLERREEMAKAAHIDVEEIPTELVPTPLRRVVQILKRHRDIRFQGNTKDKPTSIIITTLAAQEYSGQANVLDALMEIVPAMQDGIKVIGGELWVPNPINPGENYADKWKDEPQRAVQFKEWLVQVKRDIGNTLSQTGGIHKIVESLSPVFGASVVSKAASLYGDKIYEQRKSNNLKMATGTGILGSTGLKTVPQHTNFGDDPQK